MTYENDWNLHDLVALEAMPLLLRQAFVMAEDHRFYAHHGPDWSARLHAAWQNLRARRAVRGASTISEQTVRMLHPRPRTLWSRWLEGWEAQALERRFSKEQILEFYLNQVPYAGRRRGVAQAARAWFDRDLSTLSPPEILALAVMVRAPARLDPKKGGDDLRRRVAPLAARMAQAGLLSGLDPTALAATPLELRPPTLAVKAGHFIRYLSADATTAAAAREGRLDTTLDASLQGRVQTILDARLRELQGREVGDGAVLVLDHSSGEILAWVNGGGDDPQLAGSMIDAILAPRQPGSTLKPFLYAAALDAGWSAATIIDDAPLSGAVGVGAARLSQLQPPVLRAVAAARMPRQLSQHPGGAHSRYPGAAAFSRPASPSRFCQPDPAGRGVRPRSRPRQRRGHPAGAEPRLCDPGQPRPAPAVARCSRCDRDRAGAQIFTAESASLIADILSDPEARRREFGRGSLLALPLQTAVKTGTSTAYNDAWALGFNHRYVVGVWMGNLDRRPMREVTGAIGPALVLRSVFAELGRNAEGAPLFLSPRLISRPICAVSGGAPRPDCPSVREWFRPEQSLPACSLDPLRHATPEGLPASAVTLALQQPRPGLQLAMDPRIPDQFESFAFELAAGAQPQQVEWLVDGRIVATTGPGVRRWLWPLQRGPHRMQARLTGASGHVQTTAAVDFTVK